MTAEAAGPPRIAIEPFDPSRHDRRAFSSGVARIDNFFHRSLKKRQAGDFVRAWVAVEEGNPAILGFFALNAHSIEAGDLPARLTKNAPRHGAIPAVYLSMIGVDRARQGKGLGRILLADALARAVAAADAVGIAAVVLDVLEEGGAEATARRARFYAAMGFLPFPSRPLRMFLPIATARRALEG